MVLSAKWRVTVGCVGDCQAVSDVHKDFANDLIGIDPDRVESKAAGAGLLW
jgi:hypothetical protein